MSQDLNLAVVRKAAPALLKGLRLATSYAATADERLYLQSLTCQVQTFIDTPEPTYAKVTVLARDGVPEK